jgi:hypothetical protein
MGKRSRDKGAAWERQVAKDMTEATGFDCRRCLIETQQGNKGDIASDAPYSVQCKVGQRPNVYKALDEAVEAAEDGDLAVAIIKKNGGGGKPPQEFAAIPLDDFYRIVRGIHERGENGSTGGGSEER